MSSWPKLQENIREFGRTSEDEVSNFIEAGNTNPPAGQLYHYTDHSGLVGILESETLWLTDLFCLNDPSELQHGIDHALDVLKRRTPKDRPEVVEFYDKFLATSRRDLHESAEYFVGSFSSNGDYLDQWRAHGDNGQGYALGFDGPSLVTAFDSGAQGRSSFPIIYGPRRLHNIYRRLVDLLIPHISSPRGMNLRDDEIDDYMAQLSETFALSLITLSMQIKHPAYKYEHEHRLLQMFSHNSAIDGLRHRSKGTSLVRYISFEWKMPASDLLRSIVIGPAADSHRATQFATDCCNAFLKNRAAVNIRQSSLPYRT